MVSLRKYKKLNSKLDLCLFDSLESQSSEYAPSNFCSHHLLDFLQRRHAQGTCENSFLLKSKMAILLCELSNGIWSARRFHDDLPQFVVNCQQFKDCQATKVAPPVALLAYLDLDRVSLGVDSLLGWRRYGRLKQLLHSAYWDTQLLQQLRSRLKRLFALFA